MIKSAWVLAAALLVALLASGEAEARWLKAESPRFVVYSDGEAKELAEYTRRLEVFDNILRRYHGMALTGTPPRKLPVYLVKDMQSVAPGIAAEVAGFYSARTTDLFAVALRSLTPADREWSQEVIQHEYVHHFMLYNFPAAHPKWLIEGYAEYFMTVRIEPERVTIGEPSEMRGWALTGGDWLPLERLIAKSTGQIREDQQVMYYPEAWALTHWFMSDDQRRLKLFAYDKAVSEGADPVAEMEKAAGMPMAALNRTLKSYKRPMYGAYDAKLFGNPATPTVTELSPAESDLLMLRRQVTTGGSYAADDDADDDEDEAKAEARIAARNAALLTRVRAAVKRHGDEPYAQFTLARAEVYFGDVAAGQGILERLLARDPQSVEALELLAAAQLRDIDEAPEADRPKRARAAIRFVNKALEADQSAYQTWLLAARARSYLPNYPQESDIDLWKNAYDLAPQVTEIRMQAAKALMKRGRNREAVLVIAPVANYPHGGKTVEKARKLLDEATAGMAAQAAPAAAK